MSLFQLGHHLLHSGEHSQWIIDSQHLTDADLEAIGMMIADRLPAFGLVEGVPRGGLRLAEVMRHYATAGPLLIVDDVTTTGASLEHHRAGREAVGAVIFSRGQCPYWVLPLFQLADATRWPYPTQEVVR